MGKKIDSIKGKKGHYNRVAKATLFCDNVQLQKKYHRYIIGLSAILGSCIVGIIIITIGRYHDDKMLINMQESLKESVESNQVQFNSESYVMPTAGIETALQNILGGEIEHVTQEQEKAEILTKYRPLHEQNSDIIGWLTIKDTVIDYPVMQTMEDEDYYLNYDFNKVENKNGSLIMDTDSIVGTGTSACQYRDGTKPSTNLIIHGHTMKSGLMFGNLIQYADENYGKTHSIICFDSLYEERKYELIAVFYSQVYMNTDDVFKYYKFFQADSREEFDDWYNNIQTMSLYDTGVTAEYGDEFITMSSCAYHVEDGRFVVVGKRIIN